MAVLNPQALERVLSAPLPDLMRIRTARTGAPNRALTILESLLKEPRTNDQSWQLQLAETYLRIGDATGALEHARAAMRIDAEQRGIGLMPKAWYIQAHALMTQGIYGGARQLLEQLEAVAIGLGDETALGLANDAFGWLLLRCGSNATGEYNESFTRFAKALEIWTKLDADREQITAMEGLACILLHMDRHFEALETIDSALHLSETAEEWSLTHRLLLDRGLALMSEGYRQLAEEAFQLALDWCAFEGDEHTRARALIGLGTLYDGATDARYYRSEPTLRAAIDLAEKIKAPVLTMEARMSVADHLSHDGQHDRAHIERAKAAQIADTVSTEGTRRFLEVREAERKLREDLRRQRFERKMREAFEGSLDAIFIFDVRQGTDGSIVDLVNEMRNTAATEMIETTPNAIRLLSELADHPVFAGLLESFRKVIEAHEQFDDEIQATVHGEERWYTRRIVPMSEGAAVTIRDVTERRNAETSLVKAAEAAQSADKAKTQFLAHMSHEVRTPITGVLGLARLLAEMELDEVQKTYVEGIVANAEILLGVIGDLLDLSKIEAGHLRIELNSVNLRKLIDDAARLFAEEVRTKGLELKASVDEDVPPFVRIDGGRLRQILVNLIGNAIKFTERGTITVRVSSETTFFRIEVRDTGIGIAEDEQNRIFMPFEQVEAGRKQGTGLGLAISKRLVDLMGGTIGVESRLGDGSLFWLDLPLEEALGSLTERGDVRPKHNLKQFRGKRALLVEDNRFNALIAKTLLTKLGFDVTVVTDGPEAVEAAATGFDVILMDVRLVTMDGLEATRQIRQAELTRGGYTPVIAVTAAALTTEREECLAAGMDEYLGKPFTIDSLRTALENHVK